MKFHLISCMYLFVVCSCNAFKISPGYVHMDNELALKTENAVEIVKNLALSLSTTELKLFDYFPGVGLSVALDGKKFKAAEVDFAVGKLLGTGKFQDGIYEFSTSYGALSASANSRGEGHAELTTDLITARISPKLNGDFLYNVNIKTLIFTGQMRGNRSAIQWCDLQSNVGPVRFDISWDHDSNHITQGYLVNIGFKGFDFYVNPQEINRFGFNPLNGQIIILYSPGNFWEGTLFLGPLGAQILNEYYDSVWLNALLDLKYVKVYIKFKVNQDKVPYVEINSCSIQVLNYAYAYANFRQAIYTLWFKTNIFVTQYHRLNDLQTVTAWLSFRGYGLNLKLSTNNQYNFKVVLNDKYSIIPLPRLGGNLDIGF